MLEKTEGLVLKTVKYSESSVIARVYTREKGWLNFHIPGVRSRRNKSGGNLFQPLQYLELDIYHHPGKNLLKIKEYRPAIIFSEIPFDMRRQSIAIFALEVLGKCLHEHEVNTEIYDYFRQFLAELDRADKSPSAYAPTGFMLDLSRLLGFAPMASHSGSSGEGLYFHLQDGRFETFPDHTGPTLNQKESQLLLRYLDAPALFSGIANERQQLLDIMIQYFQVHVPAFGKIHSIEVLRQILRA